MKFYLPDFNILAVMSGDAKKKKHEGHTLKIQFHQSRINKNG